MTKMIRIIIADDHPIVLLGIRSVLATKPNIAICGEAHDSESLIKLIENQKPDMVITDYNMPGESSFGDGERLLNYLQRHYPDIKLIVLTMLNNPLMLKHTMSLGVDGILLKSENLNELYNAIIMIQDGEKYFAKSLRPLSRRVKPNELNQSPLAKLSPKESEVIRLYLDGKTITEIAQILHRSIKTISAQKNQALRKLDIQNEKELFEFSIKNRL